MSRTPERGRGLLNGPGPRPLSDVSYFYEVLGIHDVVMFINQLHESYASTRHWVMSTATRVSGISGGLWSRRWPRGTRSGTSCESRRVSAVSLYPVASGLQIGLQRRSLTCDFVPYLRDREPNHPATSTGTSDTTICARGSGAHSTAVTTVVITRTITTTVGSMPDRPPRRAGAGRCLATRTSSHHVPL